MNRPVPVRDDSGRMSLLIIGFFVVGVILLAVVVDASAAYLRRTSMNNLADGAALAAAEGVQGHHVYTTGLDSEAPIDVAVARRHVQTYLEHTGAHASYPGLRWRVEPGPDGRVRVRVSAPLDLPFTIAGIADGTTVTGEATVRVRIS